MGEIPKTIDHLPLGSVAEQEAASELLEEHSELLGRHLRAAGGYLLSASKQYSFSKEMWALKGTLNLVERILRRQVALWCNRSAGSTKLTGFCSV